MRRPSLVACVLLAATWSRPSIAQEDAPDGEPEAPPPPEEGPTPSEETEAEVPVEETEEEPSDSINLTAPAQPGKGAIVGVVSQQEDGEPSMDTFVGVVGTNIAVLTDIDGSYRLDLPPGKYTIQIVAELRRPLRSSVLVVTKGKLTRLDAKVENEKDEPEPAVETVVEIEPASVQSLLLERQRSAAAGDSVGRAEITKANDRNAAEAARRVVGANIEGSRFLFVRGLGERYTNALLDGFPLPSPEPDRQAVPLDLFPSQILDSLTVVKTFTPDVPGDFAGGSVRIATRRIPSSLVLAGSVSTGFNTNASFAQNLSHGGGSFDWLGIDDGTRALDDGIPDVKIDNGLDDGKGGTFSNDEVRQLGKLVNSSLGAYRSIGVPNLSANVVAADSFALGDWGRLGVLGAMVYDRRLERVTDGIVNTYGGEREDGVPGLKEFNTLRSERSTALVAWGALTGATLEVGKNHTFNLNGLYSRAADVSTQFLVGRHEERDQQIADTRLNFVARQLFFGSFTGSHVIPEANSLKIEYGVGLARATREQPDFRGAVYQLDDSDPQRPVWSFEDDSSSGLHFFSNQGETTWSGKLDVTAPLSSRPDLVAVKTGAAFNVRSRDFDSRRLRFRAPGGTSCPGSTYDLGCPDGFFTDANLDAGLIDLEENTRENDGYEAALSVIGSYVMVDARPHPQWRITAGPRLEVSAQSISPFNPTARDEAAEAEDFREYDELILLPAALLTYQPVPKANLRLSVTQTVARPQLRELAPFQFADFFGGRETRGNPDLINTSIVNADTRFEFFPTSREVLAVSAFYKNFSNPIEQVVDPSTGSGIVTFINAESANLFGVEFEARKSLDFITEALRPLSVITNLTLAHSRVGLTDEQAANLFSQSRPLSQQAPVIINAALDFDYPDTGTRARLQYNVVGPRIWQVGTRGLPDIYEQPRHLLDLTLGQRIGKHVELRGAASNLLDWKVKRVHQYDGPEAIVEEFTLGRTFSLGANITY
jgi:hypothetical protein